MLSFCDDVYELNSPENLRKIQRMNQIWMLSLVHHDSLPQQVIGYMESIDLPSTRLDAVQETVRIAQKLVHECGDKKPLFILNLQLLSGAHSGTRVSEV